MTDGIRFDANSDRYYTMNEFLVVLVRLRDGMLIGLIVLALFSIEALRPFSPFPWLNHIDTERWFLLSKFQQEP